LSKENLESTFCKKSKNCLSIEPIHKLNYTELNDQNKFDLSWYVIGTPNSFSKNKLKQITIWSKNYVVWKDSENNFHALDDVCSHKSASLARGKLINDTVMCPYHGYRFNNNGTLVSVPGINFQHSCIHDVKKYKIVNKNGWLYLNTFEGTLNINASHNQDEYIENIFVEEEAIDKNFNPVFLNMNFNCYSRVLSENSLDVMHIGFVHTFGNSENPAPILEDPPKLINNYHYKTSYLYEAGRKSMAKKIFLFNNLTIENEFILPHTTIARVKFGELISTVMTFALPINMTHSELFVKTYRNFWNENDIVKLIGDKITYKMMYQTMLQDKYVVESISTNCEDGKFNMKFDKLQNTYVSLYKKLIHKKYNI
jgi:phenylpropionate dioxygenase-like ring-hydroxylating dioxygenase large terminal subunit